jgi:hypothetical protein
VREVRLRFVPLVGADFQAKALLLSLFGFRRISLPERSGLRQPAIRQDYLDSFIWAEILRLLDDPTLIQAELDRRMEVAKKADPLLRREESLQRERVRIQKNIDRLVTAYQEGLVTLEQLRHRMPELRR